MNWSEQAPRSERLKLPLKLRLFYRGRPLGRLACQCLINECMAHGQYQDGGMKGARPHYKESRLGRRTIV
jgi:hypothetical protein